MVQTRPRAPLKLIQNNWLEKFLCLRTRESACGYHLGSIQNATPAIGKSLHDTALLWLWEGSNPVLQLGKGDSKVPRFVRAAFVDHTHHCVILRHQWPARHPLAKLLGHFNQVDRMFDSQAADRSRSYVQPVARSVRRAPSRDSVGSRGG